MASSTPSKRRRAGAGRCSSRWAPATTGRGSTNDPNTNAPTCCAARKPFDCLVAPADPDVGVFAEVFRTRPARGSATTPRGGSQRPGHSPTGCSTTCHGTTTTGPDPRSNGSSEPTAECSVSAPISTRSPCSTTRSTWRRCRRSGAVRRHRLVLGRNGPEVRVVNCLDDSDGIVDVPGEDYFAVILREYLATGRGIDRHRRRRDQRAHRSGRHRRVRRVMDGRHTSSPDDPVRVGRPWSAHRRRRGWRR